MLPLVFLIGSCSDGGERDLSVCGELVELVEGLEQLDGLGDTDGYVVNYLVGEPGQEPPRSIADLIRPAESNLVERHPGSDGSHPLVTNLGSFELIGGECRATASLWEGEAAQQVLIGSGVDGSDWVASVSWPA